MNRLFRIQPSSPRRGVQDCQLCTGLIHGGNPATVDTIWATVPANVTVGNNKDIHGLAITFGDGLTLATQGITITSGVTTIAADSENGWIGLNQTVSWHAQFWDRPDWIADSVVSTMADGCVFLPTGGAPVHATGGHYHLEVYDSPGLKLLDPPADSGWYKFDATSQVMFKPGGAQTIWVPLLGAAWGFDASAVDPSHIGVAWQMVGVDHLYVNLARVIPIFPGVFPGVINPATCPIAFN